MDLGVGKQQIEWINGMKGIMAIIVVMSHLKWAFMPVIDSDFWFYKFPISEISNGGMAVSAFICLSAIIMTIKCADSSKWQQILLKRYFRLCVPISLIMLLYVLLYDVGVLFNMSLYDSMDNGWFYSAPAPGYKTLIKVLLTTPFSTANSFMNTHWMLKYMLYCPFVVVLLNIITKELSAAKEIVIILFCIIICAILDPWMISIFVGYGYAKYIYGNTALKDIKNGVRLAILLALLALYVIVEHASSFLDQSVWTIKGLIIVLLVLLCEPFQKILSNRIIVWLGSVSFEVYLLHILVIFSLGCWIYMYVPYFCHRLICIYVCVVLISVLTAWVWAAVINRPINKLVNKGINKYLAR